jgi:hypothetical protein
MRKIFFFLVVLILKTTPSVCQGCKTYDCAIQAAEVQLKNGKYEKALTNLDDAEDFSASDNTKKEKIRILRKLVFNAIVKDKQDAVKAKDEAKQQKDRADYQAKEAKKQTVLANKNAKQSQSKELAAKAMLMLIDRGDRGRKTETIALRLAYEALKIDSTNEAIEIFDEILSTSENEYYSKKYHSINQAFNNDTSFIIAIILTPDSNYINDLDGNSYNWIAKFNKDSTDFWKIISMKNDTFLVKLRKKNEYSFLKARDITNIFRSVDNTRYGHLKDSSITWIYNLQGYSMGSTIDSTVIKGKNGELIGKIKGWIRAVNSSNNKIIVASHFDSKIIIQDFKGVLYNQLEGQFVSILPDSSKFFLYKNDTMFLCDWEGIKYNSFFSRGFPIFNKNSTSVLINQEFSYQYSPIFEYRPIILKTFKGEFKGYSNDDSNFWIRYKDTSKLVNCKGEVLKNFEGSIDISSNFINKQNDNDTTNLYSIDGKKSFTFHGFFRSFITDSMIHGSDNWGSSQSFTYNFIDKQKTIFQGENLISFNKGSTKLITFADGYFHTFLYKIDGTLIRKFEGAFVSFNKDSSQFWIHDAYYSNLCDWDGNVIKSMKWFIEKFNNDFSKFIIHNKAVTYINNFKNSDSIPLRGHFLSANSNISLIYTVESDSIFVYDWNGKIYNKVKGDTPDHDEYQNGFTIYDTNDYKGFDQTHFYNWFGEHTVSYPGRVFCFSKDNKKVVMEVEKFGRRYLETRELFNSVHEFLKKKVAELMPEERVLYGVDDYPKN